MTYLLKAKKKLETCIMEKPQYKNLAETFFKACEEFSVEQLIDFDVDELIELKTYKIIFVFLKYLSLAPLANCRKKLMEYFSSASGLGQDVIKRKALRFVTNCYISGLCKEINACKNFDEILELVEVYQELSSIGVETKSIKNELVLKITMETWNLVEETQTRLDRGDFFSSLNSLCLISEASIDLSSVIPPLFESIHCYLQSRYNIYNLANQISDNNHKDGKKIVSYLAKLPITDPTQQIHLKNLEDFFGTLFKLDANSDFIRPSNVPSMQIDFNDLKYVKTIYSNVDHPKIHLNIHHYSSPTKGNIALKVYQAVESANDLKNVNTEIDILETLSTYANEDNCFMKFFGRYWEDKTVYLAMEYHPRTLMKVISDMKASKSKFSEEYILHYTFNLLQGFTFLESLNILHKDIKPHNILVTDNWRLKIIDFSVSKKKNVDEPVSFSTGVNLIQGTKGYMAPEIEEILRRSQTEGKFRQNKADVFSLGITLLQIYTMDELYTLNFRENHARLMEKVKFVSIAWFRTLLEKMLNLDYNLRPTFRECLQFLPIDTKTVVN